LISYLPPEALLPPAAPFPLDVPGLLMFVRFVLLTGGINLTQLSTSAYSVRFGPAYIRIRLSIHING